MKKYLLVVCIALVALVLLPAAVLAGPADTVVVSGSIGGYIDVNVTPDAGVPWGLMTVGTKTDLTTADLEVNTTYNAWHVDAADAKAPNKGRMVDGTLVLTQPFFLSVNGGTFQSMMNTYTNFAQLTSNGAGVWSYNIGLRQEIVPGDEAGTNYQITLTYTGVIN
jgi:hypothetical protein